MKYWVLFICIIGLGYGFIGNVNANKCFGVIEALGHCNIDKSDGYVCSYGHTCQLDSTDQVYKCMPTETKSTGEKCGDTHCEIGYKCIEDENCVKFKYLSVGDKCLYDYECDGVSLVCDKELLQCQSSLGISKCKHRLDCKGTQYCDNDQQCVDKVISQQLKIVSKNLNIGEKCRPTRMDCDMSLDLYCEIRSETCQLSEPTIGNCVSGEVRCKSFEICDCSSATCQPWNINSKKCHQSKIDLEDCETNSKCKETSNDPKCLEKACIEFINKKDYFCFGELYLKAYKDQQVLELSKSFIQPSNKTLYTPNHPL
ncbi:hypothetical protein DLAC_11031 [Tieghemostelium lacteum]|uniref:Dickkopf N-terminal cysteine-rich domain-containing protein n=1 Tax=Tieghemostelium lacteum TaxID=361077 RepID=A0A151Z2Z8_TIELA|nr:hypothetical protein DLAC_11031 [Tieghemostelium lacteum]|eukprot:KYQ88333.1 hypothetical protein DLAC_11031 [Tieghemostelium lacteum]